MSEYRQQQRQLLINALSKPSPSNWEEANDPDFFNPWNDVIKGISGDYSSDSDDMMISVLEAVQDGKTFELIEKMGFVAEFALYVLAGHDLTEYGTSPRGAWPSERDLWPQLIDKWKQYREGAWT